MHGRSTPRAPRYRVVPYPAQRQAVLDVLAAASRQYPIHGLIEADVTAAREALRRAVAGSSFTAFVVATVAQAVGRHPQVNARRVGRRLVLFDDVDVVVTVERPLDGVPTPMPTIIRQVTSKTPDTIAAEIAAATRRPVTRAGDLTDNRALTAMPAWMRRLAIRAAGRVPSIAARFAPPVGVSSLGMFGACGGWGIPLSPMTVMVTVGGLVRRPALVDGAVVEREMLPLTLSFDHSVVDGAPAARFAATLQRMFETAEVLTTQSVPAGDGKTTEATTIASDRSQR